MLPKSDFLSAIIFWLINTKDNYMREYCEKRTFYSVGCMVTMINCDSRRSCPYTYDCPRHGKCCACVVHHRDNNEGVPGCSFLAEAKAACDRVAYVGICTPETITASASKFLWMKIPVFCMVFVREKEGQSCMMLYRRLWTKQP